MNPSAKDVELIIDGLYRIQTPNLGGSSGQPTNVYVVGGEPATLIDAGAEDDGATVLAALDQLGICHVSKILLTHAHHDHAGSASAIRAATGATVALHQRDFDGLSHSIEIDEHLTNETIIDAPPFKLRVLTTPGHSPGHVSFYEPSLKALFAGDLVSGFGSVAIVPPRGSMGDYLASLRRVQTLSIATIYPGHGPIIDDGNGRLAWYITHRERREEEIFELISEGVSTVNGLTEQLYPDVLPRLRSVAASTVLAHVINLLDTSWIKVEDAHVAVTKSRFFPARKAQD